MAMPEFVENIEIQHKARQGVYAYIDGKLLGRVVETRDGLTVELMAKKFRYYTPGTLSTFTNVLNTDDR